MKAYKLLYAVGMIDHGYVACADAEWQRKLHRRPKIILMSAACLALSMAMLFAAFSWMNQPTGDPAGTTPPGNILPEGTPQGNEGTTPTPPDEDTPNEPLSEVLEVGYSSSSGGGSGDVSSIFKIAIKMDRTADISQEKIPVTVSFGVHQTYNKGIYDLSDRLNYTVTIALEDDEDLVVLKEMSFNDFLDEGYFYNCEYTYNKEGYTIKTDYIFAKEETLYLDTALIVSNIDETKREWLPGNTFSISIGFSDIPYGHDNPGEDCQTVYILKDDSVLSFYTFGEYIQERNDRNGNWKY